MKYCNRNYNSFSPATNGLPSPGRFNFLASGFIEMKKSAQGEHKFTSVPGSGIPSYKLISEKLTKQSATPVQLLVYLPSQEIIFIFYHPPLLPPPPEDPPPNPPKPELPPPPLKPPQVVQKPVGNPLACRF